MPLPLALFAAPTVLSGLYSVAGAGTLVATGVGVSKISTSLAIAWKGGMVVNAMLGSGKYVYPMLSCLAGGAALCSSDKRLRAVLAGTAALLCAGPLAGALAPVLGTASTGASISTLKGAALWNAALAKLGGGTLASGGGGVMMGTANVSAAGATAGWTTGKKS